MQTNEARAAYITGLGVFLPGAPVGNEEMEGILGLVEGRPSRHRLRVLERNGIRSRHYALDRSGNRSHANFEMAARSVSDAIAHAGIERHEVDYLAAATTLSDVLVPGFASLVQGEAKIPACDIASYHGVCASGVAALKGAYAQVIAGLAGTAISCGSEFASRHLRGSVLESSGLKDRRGDLPFDTEFLRWMLSDGAGAAVISNRPAAKGLSLRIDLIDIRSHADTRETCMYAGATKLAGGGIERLWGDNPSYDQSAHEGMFVLRQDLAMIPAIVPLGISHFFRLINSGQVTSSPDWLVCHYSSAHFKKEIVAQLAKTGVDIPEERWFSNLETKGNIGSASIYVLLEELMHSGRLKLGERILCMVPESGRFITCYVALTVVDGQDLRREGKRHADEKPPAATPASPQKTGFQELKCELVRKLAIEWSDFSESLRLIPILARINNGRCTMGDYRELLLNLRQQVVEGSRWISRAASSFTQEHFELRSMFTRHAAAEHRDFLMLQNDFAATGGDPALMTSTRKNIGSEALSAWMFHAASRENPFCLAGAMAMIEGLGTRMAGEWGGALRRHLGLPAEQVTFLLYHGKNDGTHLEALDEAIGLILLSAALIDDIVHTARVTARLYRLQLEELGNR
jgi:3-oxoacyl-[acyl-carrier-protein] synthase-3